MRGFHLTFCKSNKNDTFQVPWRVSQMTAMKNLLLVEDNPDIRRLLRMTLERPEWRVHEAANGEEGLQAADRLRPEVVLLDVMMPGAFDGLEVCRRLRADPRLAGCRVVILSARGSPADLARGRSAGADAYLVKPFSPLQLVDLVTRLMAGERAPAYPEA